MINLEEGFPPKRIYQKLEFQGPTGPLILAPAVGWLATLTFSFASLNLVHTNEQTLRGDMNTNEQTLRRDVNMNKQTLF